MTLINMDNIKGIGGEVVNEKDLSTDAELLLDHVEGSGILGIVLDENSQANSFYNERSMRKAYAILGKHMTAGDFHVSNTGYSSVELQQFLEVVAAQDRPSAAVGVYLLLTTGYAVFERWAWYSEQLSHGQEKAYRNALYWTFIQSTTKYWSSISSMLMLRRTPRMALMTAVVAALHGQQVSESRFLGLKFGESLRESAPWKTMLTSNSV